MANWKNADDYPPIDCDLAILGWEFARRNADIKSGKTYFENAPDLDPLKPHWERTTGGVSFNGRLLMFSNALFPARAASGATLGVAKAGHMHVDIDLTEPLSETFRKIEILAKYERSRLPKEISVHEHAKFSVAKLIQYLRILDAKEAGASSREIEAELQIGSTAVEDGFARGKELRDGAWRDIARMKSTIVREESKPDSTGNKSRKQQ